MRPICFQRQMMFGKKTFTARDYVQDGLIAMWDGIENAGWGVHDPNATVWKDLVGSRNLTNARGDVTEDGVIFPSGMFNSDPIALSSYTIEVLWTNVTNGDNTKFGREIKLQSPTVSFNRYGSVMIRGNRMYFDYSKIYKYGIVNIPTLTTFIIDGTTASSYRNCTSKESVPYEFIYGDYCIGMGNGWERQVYNCIRIYDHDIDLSVMQTNYAVDKARFNLPDVA